MSLPQCSFLRQRVNVRGQHVNLVFTQDLFLRWHLTGTAVTQGKLNLLGGATVQPDIIRQVRSTKQLDTFTIGPVADSAVLSVGRSRPFWGMKALPT